jgi:hypothetical protein
MPVERLWTFMKGLNLTSRDGRHKSAILSGGSGRRALMAGHQSAARINTTARIPLRVRTSRPSASSQR